MKNFNFNFNTNNNIIIILLYNNYNNIIKILNTIKATSLARYISLVVVEGVDNFFKKYEPCAKKKYKNRKVCLTRRPVRSLTEAIASTYKRWLHDGNIKEALAGVGFCVSFACG